MTLLFKPRRGTTKIVGPPDEASLSIFADTISIFWPSYEVTMTVDEFLALKPHLAKLLDGRPEYQNLKNQL